MNNQMPYPYIPNNNMNPPFYGPNQLPNDKYSDLEKEINRLNRQLRTLENRVARIEGSMNITPMNSAGNSGMYMV